MKFFYGINSTGQGHINRSRVVIEQLQKEGDQVDLLFMGPKPPKYVTQLSKNIMHRKGPTLKYRGNQINLPSTYFYVLTHVPHFLKIFRDLFPFLKKQNYDAFFTDFDIYSSIAGLLLKKPVISIDHQHSIFHSLSQQVEGKFFDVFSAKLAINLEVPYCSRYFAIDYVTTIKKQGKGTLVPLVWKPEFDRYPPQIQDHYTAYLAKQNPKDIINTFTQFPDEKILVFGFDIEKTIKNIEFKKTSRSGFLQALATSKGVITNAGFSTTWEALMLQKNLWVIPYPHQFEQYTNATRLKKLNLAHVSHHITATEFQQFLKFNEKNNYRQSTKLPIIHPKVLTRLVKNELRELLQHD